MKAPTWTIRLTADEIHELVLAFEWVAAWDAGAGVNMAPRAVAAKASALRKLRRADRAAVRVLEAVTVSGRAPAAGRPAAATRETKRPQRTN